MANLNSRFHIPTSAEPRRFKTWMQMAVIGVIFLLAIFLATHIANRAGYLVEPIQIIKDPLLLVLPAAAIILLLLQRPELGLVGMIFAGLVIPVAIGTGTQTRLNIAVLLLVLLLGLWTYRSIVDRRPVSLVASRTMLPLLLFVGAAIISYIVGQLPWFYFAQKASLFAQIGGLLLFVLAAGAFLIVASQVRDIRWLEWMAWIYLAIASIYIFGKLIPGVSVYTDRIVHHGAYSNSIFWIWTAALAFSQMMFNRKLAMIWRFALGILLLATFIEAIGKNSAWTSGWLPPAFAILVILLISGSRWSRLAILGGAIIGLAKFQRVQGLLFGGDNEYGLMTRLAAWRIIGDIIKVDPVFGLGPANYYRYTLLFPILGYNVQFNSHNNYVDLIAQVGILGTLFFLWFVWELWRVGWWLRTRVPEGFMHAYVLGALGGLAATLAAGMLGDWFLPFIYNIGFDGFRASVLGWMFLGGLVAIEQILRAQEKNGTSVLASQLETHQDLPGEESKT